MINGTDFVLMILAIVVLGFVWDNAELFVAFAYYDWFGDDDKDAAPRDWFDDDDAR